MVRRSKAFWAALSLVLIATLLVDSPTEATAFTSVRDFKCMGRADRYAEESHPEVAASELADRIDWLYSQCAESRGAEAIAEEQGSKAPELFPDTEKDRHAHPLHCMSLTDSRFGMHTEQNAANPPDDLNGPGGSATLNIPGEFMYAWIDGKARFLVRYVVWTVDDRDGDPLTPVRINNHPTYMGTPQTTVAELDFAQAYQPVSVWVEMPDTMAVANSASSGLLPGRRLTARTWMESHCHDKRDPTVIPTMLIERMEDLGWLRSEATPKEPRLVSFKANGDPNEASSWSLQELPVSVPPQVNSRAKFRWFYDTGVVYNQSDEARPTKPKNLVGTAKGVRKIRLEWDESTDNADVAGYIVYRDGKRIRFTTNTFLVNKGLWPDTQYQYKVVAVDEAGNRSFRSRIVKPKTKADTTPPSKPKNVTYEATRSTIELDWDRATDNVEVSHYVVRVDGETVATTGASSFRVIGLEPRMEYHIAVRAVDVFGNLGKLVHRIIRTRP